MSPTPNYPGTRRALFALWTLFWLLMVSVAIQEQSRNPYVRWWEPILWESSSCLVATFGLLLQRHMAWRVDRYLDRPLLWFGKQLAWLPVMALTFITVVFAIRHGIYSLTDKTYHHADWAFVYLYESIKFSLFMGLWLAIIFGLESFTSWRREREQLLVMQKSLAESQLAQLKAQLQPHFLFNALNTISALMQTDVERADRLLTRLADLLRASLTVGSKQMTSLRDEWKLLELYASIMQERYGERVSLAWNASDEALAATVPAMLLQPLLENAYKHGVEHSSQPVSIRVEARRQDAELLVRIHNTGSWRESPQSGIGLRNSRERLALAYGERARLTVAPLADGVTASVTLPYEPFRA